MRKIYDMKAVTLFVAAVLMAGCSGGGTQDLESWVEEVRSRQNSRIEPLPEFKPYETFLYQAQDLRSPFQPGESRTLKVPGEEPKGSGIRPDMNRVREPLEEYPLDSLRMVGTLEQGGQSWALVQTKEGTIHRVQPGNYLGQNYGRITRITESQIELVEIVPDGLGGWMERPATLALSE